METIVYLAQHLFTIRDDREDTTLPEIADDDELCVDDGSIMVQSSRGAGNAPVFVEIFEHAPPEAPARFAKVCEAGLELKTGTLLIEGEQNESSHPELRVSLKPGRYGVRVLFADMDTCTYDSSDGAEHYVVQVWPAKTLPKSRTLRAAPQGEETPEPPRLTDAELQAQRLALQSTRPSERASAAVALIRAAQTDGVIELLSTDPSPGVRLVVAAALGAAASPEVVARALKLGQQFKVLARSFERREEVLANERRNNVEPALRRAAGLLSVKRFEGWASAPKEVRERLDVIEAASDTLTQADQAGDLAAVNKAFRSLVDVMP